MQNINSFDFLFSLIDPDVVDHERLVPGVEPLVARLPELPSLGVGVVAPGCRGFTSLVERPPSGLS